MEEFLEFAAEIFEVEPNELSDGTDFRKEIEDWSSLMGFSLIVMIDNEYGVNVSVDEFLTCRTLGDLFAKTRK